MNHGIVREVRAQASGHSLEARCPPGLQKPVNQKTFWPSYGSEVLLQVHNHLVLQLGPLQGVEYKFHIHTLSPGQSSLDMKLPWSQDVCVALP